MSNGPVLNLEAYTSVSAQQTDSVLVASQDNKRIVVYQLYVSAVSDIVVTFKSGTTEVWRQHVAAGGGSVVPFTGVEWFKTGKGVALTYSTNGAVNVAVALKGAAL